MSLTDARVKDLQIEERVISIVTKSLPSNSSFFLTLSGVMKECFRLFPISKSHQIREGRGVKTLTTVREAIYKDSRKSTNLLVFHFESEPKELPLSKNSITSKHSVNEIDPEYTFMGRHKDPLISISSSSLPISFDSSSWASNSLEPPTSSPLERSYSSSLPIIA